MGRSGEYLAPHFGYGTDDTDVTVGLKKSNERCNLAEVPTKELIASNHTEHPRLAIDARVALIALNLEQSLCATDRFFGP